MDVTAGWGHAGKSGVTMPGKGKLSARPATAEETFVVPPASGTTNEPAETPITYDVYLNDVAYWRNVPPRVWEYTIGGYQVMKKWLSYRERALLGRGLTAPEVREVTQMVRRIAALLWLEPQLDENYRRVKAATYTWAVTSMHNQ